MYEQTKGVIPEGFVVRHTCDNPKCLNPDHLIVGTVDDNVSDRVERLRTNNHVSKELVPEIVKLREEGLSQKCVAEKVGCSQMWISKFERGLFKRFKM